MKKGSFRYLGHTISIINITVFITTLILSFINSTRSTCRTIKKKGTMVMTTPTTVI